MKKLNASFYCESFARLNGELITSEKVMLTLAVVFNRKEKCAPIRREVESCGHCLCIWYGRDMRLAPDIR